MSDVTLDFGLNDRASGKLKQIKASADAAQWSLKEGAKAMELGGEKFGRMGRIVSNLGGMTGGMQLLGGAAFAASLAFGALMSASDTAVESVKTQCEWQKKLRDELKATASANAATGAAGVSQIPSLRKLMSRGGSMAQVNAAKMAGIDHGDAVSGETELQSISDPKRREAIRSAAIQAARLGEGSYTEAITKLKDMRGAINGRRALVMLRGQTYNETNLKSADASLSALDATDSPFRNMDNAMTTAGVVPGMQADRVLNGQASNDVRDANQDTVNRLSDPRGYALSKIEEATRDTEKMLMAAAKAQGSLAGTIKYVASTFGMGDADENTKLRNFSRDARVKAE